MKTPTPPQPCVPTVRFPPNLTRYAGHREFLNPGNLTDLHRKCRAIAPEWLEGIHLTCRRQCSPHLAMLFNSTLSHTTPCGVRVGAQWSRALADDQNVMRSPFVHVDLNPSTLCTNVGLQYQPLKWLRAEVSAQVEPFGDATLLMPYNSARFDIIGGAFTGTLYAWNLQKNSGRLAIAYLQTLTARWSAGVEFCGEWNGNQSESSTALALRYARDGQCLAATASMRAFDVSYWRQLHDNIQIGTSVVYNERVKAAVGNVAYQWMFGDAVVRGMMDSEWSTGFTYTRVLRELCCNMGISVLFCVPTNKFACGLKFDFDANNRLY